MAPKLFKAVKVNSEVDNENQLGSKQVAQILEHTGNATIKRLSVIHRLLPIAKFGNSSKTENLSSILFLKNQAVASGDEAAVAFLNLN